MDRVGRSWRKDRVARRNRIPYASHIEAAILTRGVVAVEAAVVLGADSSLMSRTCGLVVEGMAYKIGAEGVRVETESLHSLP